ncbi:MAG TPA: glycosyltransferase family 39 protein, partial [Blastocatellia bacterium]
MSQRRQPSQRLLLPLIWFVTALAYIGILRSDFVYDDIIQIVQNPILHSWRYLPQYFSEHNSASLLPNTVGNFYRPLILALKLISYKIFGLNPLWWHTTSLAVHLAVIGLVFTLAKKIMKDEIGAALAAFIFALHPVNVEVVAWVSGITDSILALLVLASLLLYIRYAEEPAGKTRGRGLLLASSVLLYGLATLTKEAAVVLPCLI